MWKVDLDKQIVSTIFFLSRSNIIIRSSYCMSAKLYSGFFSDNRAEITEPRLPSRVKSIFCESRVKSQFFLSQDLRICFFTTVNAKIENHISNRIEITPYVQITKFKLRNSNYEIQMFKLRKFKLPNPQFPKLETNITDICVTIIKNIVTGTCY